jgi:hypothetical protein
LEFSYQGALSPTRLWFLLQRDIMQLLKSFLVLGAVGLTAAQNSTAYVNSTPVEPPIFRTPIPIRPPPTNTTLPPKHGYHNATVVVVKSYTIWCPEPTVIVVNHQSYTATGPTMLTITNCPCTITTVRIFSSPSGMKDVALSHIVAVHVYA